MRERERERERERGKLGFEPSTCCCKWKTNKIKRKKVLNIKEDYLSNLKFKIKQQYKLC